MTITTRRSPEERDDENMIVATHDSTLEDDWDELDDFDEEDDALDPLELEITEYLDDAMSTERKRNFEEKMRLEPELKRRVDEERQTLEELDKLNYLDVAESPSMHDLVEATVDRLNSETQTELDAALAFSKKISRRTRLAFVVVSIVALFAGFFAFGAMLPSARQRREADARVVERLAQLETVGEFSYLKALAASNLMEQWRQAWRAPGDRNAPKQGTGGAATTYVGGDASKSYDELEQDRVFYRLQRRFEAKPSVEQDRWRNFRRQIDEDPESEKLLKTLDDYTDFFLSSTSQEEQEKLLEESIPDRLERVRRRVNESVYFANFLKAKSQASNNRKTAQAPNAPDARPENEKQYQNKAFRAALPEEVKDEDLTSLAQKFDEYNRKHSNGGQNLFGSHEGVVQFVKDSDFNELVADFSDRAQRYITSVDSQTRSTLLGLLVSVGYLEESERQRTRMTRPLQNPTPRIAAFPQLNKAESGANRRELTHDLAESLKKAPQPVRDHILSCPQPEARGLLIRLNWLGWGNWRNWNDQNSENSQNNMARPQPNFGAPNGQPRGNMPPGQPRDNRRPGNPDFNNRDDSSFPPTRAPKPTEPRSEP